MKSIWITIVILFFLPITKYSYSQEITFGLGSMTASQLLRNGSSHLEYWPIGVTGKFLKPLGIEVDYQSLDFKASPALNASFKLNSIGERRGNFGISGSYQRYRLTTNYNSGRNEAITGAFGFLIAFYQYNWTKMQTENLSPLVYSSFGLGIGYEVNSKDIDYGWPAFQVTLLGLRIGKLIGGYCEFGFGMNGIINIGVSIKN